MYEYQTQNYDPEIHEKYLVQVVHELIHPSSGHIIYSHVQSIP